MKFNAQKVELMPMNFGATPLLISACARELAVNNLQLLVMLSVLEQHELHDQIYLLEAAQATQVFAACPRQPQAEILARHFSRTHDLLEECQEKAYLLCQRLVAYGGTGKNMHGNRMSLIEALHQMAVACAALRGVVEPTGRRAT